MESGGVGLEPEPEPQPEELELAARLTELTLDAGPPREANEAVSRPTRRLACRLQASPRILDITGFDETPAPAASLRAPRLAASRKGSILDLLAQLGSRSTIGSKALDHGPATRAPLEGFMLDASVQSDPHKPLKAAEVWDPVTKRWAALPILAGCSKVSTRRCSRDTRGGCRGGRAGNSARNGNRISCVRSGAKVDTVNETTSRLLRVSTNRGSIRRGSKRASQGGAGRHWSAQPVCAW